MAKRKRTRWSSRQRKYQVSVSARTAELLKAAAEVQGKSMAQIVEEALEGLPEVVF